MIANLTLIRDFQDEKATLGRLLFNDVPVCYTLERPWLDNQTKISCIPLGTYQGQVQPSPHFNRDLPELLDVPGRSQILMHVGNTTKDTLGCILLGLSRNIEDHSIGQSRAATQALLDQLAEYDGFMLTIEQLA